MINLQALDATIDKTTIVEAIAGKAAAIVTKDWLVEVRKDLAELAERRAAEVVRP